MKGLNATPYDHVNEGPLAGFLCPREQRRHAKSTAKSSPAMSFPLTNNITLMAHTTFDQTWPLCTTYNRRYRCRRRKVSGTLQMTEIVRQERHCVPFITNGQRPKRQSMMEVEKLSPLMCKQSGDKTTMEELAMT